MKIWIQKFGNEICADWAYAAYQGALYAGDEVKFFEDINTVPFALDMQGHPCLVVAYIEDTIKWFNNFHISIPAPLNIPVELLPFTKRKIEYKTMKEFKEDTTFPIFVKPQSKVKEFPSGVLKTQSAKEFLLNSVDENTIVQTSEIVEMLSEYRVFIHKGKIEGIKHYSGDFNVFPVDFEHEVADMIALYKNAPVSYTLDIAILKNIENSERGTYNICLVEAQDMWSIGHYGLEPEIYLKLLKRRWIEMIDVKKVKEANKK